MSGADAIVVVARWQAKAESLGGLLAMIAELRRHSLAEPGCLGYDAFQGLGEPGTILLVERYADDAALEAHRGSAHYRELVVERILPLLTDRRVEFLKARNQA